MTTQTQMQQNLKVNIKALMAKQNLTRNRLAQIVGVSTSTIDHWKSGRTIPRLNQLSSLSKVLGVTIDEILLNNIEVNKP